MNRLNSQCWNSTRWELPAKAWSENVFSCKKKLISKISKSLKSLTILMQFGEIRPADITMVKIRDTRYSSAHLRKWPEIKGVLDCFIAFSQFINDINPSHHVRSQLLAQPKTTNHLPFAINTWFKFRYCMIFSYVLHQACKKQKFF